MPQPLEWTMVLDDGPFAGLVFSIPATMVAPGFQAQVIKGSVKVMYTATNLNQQTHTAMMEQP